MATSSKSPEHDETVVQAVSLVCAVLVVRATEFEPLIFAREAT